MNELELQAYLDGELSAHDARRVAALIDADAALAALANELRATKTFLAGNEPSYALPEDPAFYWSQIQRQLKPRDEPVQDSVSWAFYLRRWLAPLGAVALATIFAIVLFRSTTQGPVNVLNEGIEMAEVEKLSPEVDTVSFRSDADNMLVIWIQEKETAAVPSEFDEEDLFF